MPGIFTTLNRIGQSPIFPTLKKNDRHMEVQLHIHAPEVHKERVEKLVEQHAKKIEKFFKKYDKTPVLEVYLNKSGSIWLRAAYSLDLKSGTVYASDKDKDEVKALQSTFKKFEKALKHALQKERKDYLYKRKNRQKDFARSATGFLRMYKMEGDEQAFGDLLRKTIPNVGAYMARRVQMAEASHHVEKGQVQLQELEKELYSQIYRQIEEAPNSSEQFDLWAFQMADAMLDKALGEPAHMQKADLDTLDKAALEKLHARFQDEQADVLRHLPADRHYQLEDVLDSDEDADLLDRLHDELTREEANEVLLAVLTQLPPLQRTIFDLSVQEGLSPQEIARIKRLQPAQVERILREVRAKLRSALQRRFGL